MTTMRLRFRSRAAVAAAACLAVLTTAGCQAWKDYYVPPPPPAPLGALSDPVWQNQEANAEASDFVIYDHEFQRQSDRLNTAGEDHVKQIAARLDRCQNVPVVVERSMSSPRADTEFHFPVNPNPELDMRRREIIVRSLAAMGVADAEQRVVVAPAYAPGMTGNEAEAAYLRGMTVSDFNSIGVGGGGGFGGFFFRGGL